MRKILLLCGLSALVALSSCNDNHDAGYIGLATIKQQSGLYLELDNGNTVRADNYFTTIASGNRALLTFRYTNILPVGSSYYADIEVYDFVNILTKEILPLSDSTTVDFGDDPFYMINQMGISGGYMNVVMSFEYGYTPHMVNLVVDSLTSVDGNFNLTLRQNDNGDTPRFIITSLASFSMARIDDMMSDQGILKATINVAVALSGSTESTYTFDYETSDTAVNPISLTDSLFQYTEYIL